MRETGWAGAALRGEQGRTEARWQTGLYLDYIHKTELLAHTYETYSTVVAQIHIQVNIRIPKPNPYTNLNAFLPFHEDYI